MDSGSAAGGILKLRELIEEHPAEVAYDFRTRFALSFEDIGQTITWMEAVLLMSVLTKDPSSWFGSARMGWEYPVSREWILLAHTYELQVGIATRKAPKPYPSPWKSDNQNQLGKRNQRRDHVLAKLEQMNPKENDG